jgi:hypothetical protein
MPHTEAGPAKEGTLSLFNGKNSNSVTNVSVPTVTIHTSTMAEFYFFCRYLCLNYCKRNTDVQYIQ